MWRAAPEGRHGLGPADAWRRDLNLAAHHEVAHGQLGRGVAEVEVDGLPRREGEDADGHFVRRHARHRVLVRGQRCLALERVDLRVVRHHALVHPVESELLPVGAPERALVDAELIPVDALAIDYFA